jgi:AcrR family transcriptional regulator
MSTRAAAAEATRERIIEAALLAFSSEWYDDVTVRGIAADAGVALQTLVNHFGTKEALFGVAVERFGDRIEAARATVAVDDIPGAITTLVDDYDESGDAIVRMLALEDRIAVLRPALERGRRGHEQWVQRVFAAALERLRGAERTRRIAELVAATDVYTWKLLRRDRGLTRRQTILAVREMVEALHNDAKGGSG